MCGRGACTMSAERCRKIAGGVRIRGAERLRPKYNLTPMSYVPVVRSCAPEKAAGANPYEDGGGKAAAREVCSMRWGLVPSFAKRAEDYSAFSGGASTFNARVEGAQSSGLWRRLLDSRRGVMLFDGFYEWRKEGKAKVPMFIRNRDDYDGHFIRGAEPPAEAEGSAAEAEDRGPRHAPLLLAALYDVWGGPKEADSGAPTPSEPLESATIMTMESDGTPMFKVHDRMPVFLTPDTAALWLDAAKGFGDIIDVVLKTSFEHSQRLHLYEVSPLVSNIKNESPDCILPKKEWDSKSLSGGLGRFFKKAEPSPKKPGAPAADAAAKAAPGDAEAGPGAKRPAEPSPKAASPLKVARITIDIDD